ncbi:cryptochrome/photolyase family protein [Pararobbsia silviterrae]|uniref:Deoxyribodipyrimidine photo-lyase n=1 Tax=Pararobbsia silviterrae TaxID=1792498 RepID=A0A494YFA6_9BURK|nr:deoxyribodipyrimidine photo-lyase [Pararobbsia silviterrae]RKP59053.1 deoxyribodipyrimidine photo-lyase [Pararobbsia silviterrae]
MSDFTCGLVWFRRDLRTADHAALYHALSRCQRVVCTFIFDTDILDPLPRDDRRVPFIHACVVELDSALRESGGGLTVLRGDPVALIPALAAELGAQAVFTNRDYEPDAIARDHDVERALAAQSIAFLTFKDQVVFEKDELLTGQNRPYTVFTPYKRAWLTALTHETLAPYAVDAYRDALAPPPTLGARWFDTAGVLGRPAAHPDDTQRNDRAEGSSASVHAASDRPRVPGIPSLAELGFPDARPPDLPAGSSGASALLEDFRDRMADYDRTRDFPGIKGPSYLSIHLRFGTVSIRGLAREAHDAQRLGSAGAATWLSELIWRDFFFQILWHFPHVGARGAHRAFRPVYDAIQWESGPAADAHFAAWCEGRTGYPLVDAAMRQINASGYMHNRLRMVVASFLVKDLGLDWRRGEAYFEAKLNDFDLAANNGGWQWAASTGCDAQPYFRIFNPITQSERFDPRGAFIRHYIPEIARLSDRDIHAPWRAKPAALSEAGIALGRDYPMPIVDHDLARRRTLERFDVVKHTRLDPD